MKIACFWWYRTITKKNKIMHNLLIQNSQLVSAKIGTTPAAGKDFKISDTGNITTKNVKLYGISAYTADQLAKSVDGSTTISAAAAKGLTVTLQDTRNNTPLQSVPYMELVRSANGGLMVMIEPIEIDLSKCYITIVDTTGLSVGQVALFNVYYELV